MSTDNQNDTQVTVLLHAREPEQSPNELEEIDLRITRPGHSMAFGLKNPNSETGVEDLSLHEVLHYLRNPYGYSEELLSKVMLEAANRLLKTPIAWKYYIAAYCDHQPASGIVLKKESLKNIPTRYITWEPVFITQL